MAIILPKYADLARDEESDRDTRVDVSAADVRNHPDDRRHAEAERQRNSNNVTVGYTPHGTRPTADKHEQQRADELRQ